MCVPGWPLSLQSGRGQEEEEGASLTCLLCSPEVDGGAD